MARSKYINTFNTTAEYNNYIESALPSFPNVGYDKEADKVNIVRTSPNNHVLYGEVVDPAQAVPTISLSGTTNTPTLDELTNMFYLDIWSNAAPTSISFGNKSNLKSIKKLKGLDTSNITEMTNMFRDCSSLTSLDLSSLNTSNVNDMFGMFWDCSSLTTLDLSNFDTSNVNSMYNMFSGCSSLTSLNLSNCDTSKVTTIQGMFINCRSITSLDLSNFNTSNVTGINSMFSDCSSLTSLDLSSFNTSKVTEIYYMFNNCSSLKSLDLSNWDTSKVTSIGHIFDNCVSLKDVYITVESTLNNLTNNLSSQGGSYIPSTATIHYNGVDYKWTGSAWTPQS